MSYLILPSNTEDVEFVNDTNSNFNVRLSQPLDLDGGEWEVAMTEILYPNTWDNVTSGKLTIGKLEVNGIKSTFDIVIESGRYSDISELLERLEILEKALISKL